MKRLTKYTVITTALVSVTFLSLDASAASLRSPRHGQETVDVSGGAKAAERASMHMMHRSGGTPMMAQGGNMEMMQACHERMSMHESMSAPGKMGMGHRSRSHQMMRDHMRKCMAHMQSSDQNANGTPMQH